MSIVQVGDVIIPMELVEESSVEIKVAVESWATRDLLENR